MDDLDGILPGITIAAIFFGIFFFMIFVTHRSDIVDTAAECYDRGYVVSQDANGQRYCDSGRNVYHIDD